MQSYSLRWEGSLDDAKALQAWLLADVPDTTVLITSEAELRMFMNGEPPELLGMCLRIFMNGA